MPSDRALRLKVFLQRLWQPTSACMLCMPGSVANVFSAVHWELALRTGVATGLLALLLSFTPVLRWYRHRWGNALLVGALTALGDAWSHANHYGRFAWSEPLLTGAVSAALALAASWLLERHAGRVRAAFARWFGARRA